MWNIKCVGTGDNKQYFNIRLDLKDKVLTEDLWDKTLKDILNSLEVG